MQMRQNGWQTLAVTSPNRGAGKSTVALNLALSFAMEADHTALLVDADLRDPYVRNMLELEPGPGLVDYLLGDAALEDLLIHPNVGNLVVLPGGAPVANTSELMRSPMMADMIRELRGRYARPHDRLRRAADSRGRGHPRPFGLYGRNHPARRGMQDPARRHCALVRAAEQLEPPGHRAQQVARASEARARSAVRNRASSSATSEPRASRRRCTNRSTGSKSGRSPSFRRRSSCSCRASIAWR